MPSLLPIIREHTLWYDRRREGEGREREREERWEVARKEGRKLK